MPFTFSHPAAILPFKIFPKKWISLTGLIVGSMVPDFEKFIKMSPGNSFSHTWEGLFLFNLPFGLLLCFVFHNVVRDSLICHLPLYFRKRLAHTLQYIWTGYFRKRYALVIISILIGTISHIGWDSITHKRGLAVRLMPFLEWKISVAGVGQPIYGMLDLISTVIGGDLFFLRLCFFQ
jgi:hypothetical protein